MSTLFLQVFVGICFIGLILILFFEKFDYILYSVLFLIIAATVSAFFLEEAREIEFYISTIEWEVILFFVGIFVIVEVLRENNFFEELARRITKKYSKSPRKLFYVLTIIATFLASIISGLSIVVIFVPLTIIICKKMEINPAPYLFSLSVCVNLAATLTPFGSAQNILISNEFGLDFLWFLTFIVPYFVITFILSLFLLDKFILGKELKKHSVDEGLEDKTVNLEPTDKSKDMERLTFHEHVDGTDDLQKPSDMETKKVFDEEDFSLDQMAMSKKDFYKNCGALLLLIVLLVVLPEIYFASIVSCLVFVFINPRKGEGSKFNLIHYLQKIDYKLIYFFSCLFIFIGLMELNGTLLLIEQWIENLSGQDEFL
ncbi:MAG: Inner membrane protein YbiR (modular protein), partial [Promethearchaeota archaeon]